MNQHLDFRVQTKKDLVNVCMGQYNKDRTKLQRSCIVELSSLLVSILDFGIYADVATACITGYVQRGIKRIDLRIYQSKNCRRGWKNILWKIWDRSWNSFFQESWS